MIFYSIHTSAEDEAVKDLVVRYLRRHGLHVDVERCDSDELETAPTYRY